MDDDVFKALADPGRRRLLDALNDRNGQTLRELCDGSGIARQSVSKHLDVLEAADLISTQRRGREKFHFLNPVPINAIAERWMNRYDRSRVEALADLKHALEQTPMSNDTENTNSTATDTTFVYVTYINTTAEQLWSALTEPAFTSQYWGVSIVSEWTVGSTITWEMERGVTVADREQVVLVADRPRRLRYTWHTFTPEFIEAFSADVPSLAQAADERRSTVTFDIEPAGELVKLTVTHEDFDPGSVVLGAVSEGWPSILASLKTLLETGRPLPFD